VELIETIEQWAWIGWLVLILVFLVIEMLTLDFTFLMLSIGGLAGLLADLLGAPIWLQVIIAAGVAAILLLVLRPPLLRRLRRGEDPTPSNIDALIGLRDDPDGAEDHDQHEDEDRDRENPSDRGGDDRTDVVHARGSSGVGGRAVGESERTTAVAPSMRLTRTGVPGSRSPDSVRAVQMSPLASLT